MKRLTIISTIAASLALAACGSSSSSDPVDTGFAQPAGTVAISFTVDDTANKLFLADEMRWKGAMIYDPATRKITKDDTWGGPWAPLYDDGPWNVTNATTGQPGHEPAGAVAGDNKWGVTVFATPPATGSVTFEYGLVDHKYGDGWIWTGAGNGSFVVAAGATTPITANGMAIAKLGDRDMRLVVEVAAIAAVVPPFDPSVVKVKGSAWGWQEVTLLDDGTKGDATAGDGKFTFVLSEYVGTGKAFSHSGLTNPGDKPEFVYVFSGLEYKDAGAALPDGVTAATKAPAGAWVDATIAILDPGNKNTYITVP